jgi:hypothetical protein
MKRALLTLLATVLCVGLAVAMSPDTAFAGGIARPHTGVNDCESGVGIATIPSTTEEAIYNDELTLCDLGTSSGQAGRYSFRNDSPVVWAFYDTILTGQLPRNNRIHYLTSAIVPLFRPMALAEHISRTNWIVAPGETVWLDSLVDVSFGVATPLINSSWLLYRQQADKLSALGVSYAKRIATTASTSRTRTFLWNCVAAGVTTHNTLKAGTTLPPIQYAAGWLSAAKADSQCASSFAKLFKKKSPTLPGSTTSVKKWFSTARLSAAESFLEDIDSSRAAMTIADEVIHIHLPG